MIWTWSKRILPSGDESRACWGVGDRCIESTWHDELFERVYEAKCYDMGECGPIFRARVIGDRQAVEQAISRWTASKT